MAGEEIERTDDGAESSTSGAEQAAPSTRKKLTGVELEARFDGWTMRRHEKTESRTPEDRAQRFRRGLAVVMGVGILVVVVASGVAAESFESTRAENETRIAGLEAQLIEAEAVPEDIDTGEQMSQLTEAAAADAEAVAAAQQGFAGLYRAASTQPSPDNGAPSQAMLDVVEHRRTLAPLFSEDSHLVDDEEAYGWSTATSFDVLSEIDPRYAWYTRYDGQDAAHPSTYSWSVETVMPDLDSQDGTNTTASAQVIWLCRDTANDEVLAWASADYAYEDEKGAFTGLEVVVTSAGEQYQHPSDRAQDTQQVPIDDLGGGGENGGGS